MAKFKLIFALVLLALVILVVFQNLQPVETRLLFWTINMPAAAFAATAMLVGIAIGVLAALALSFHGKSKDE